MRAPPHHLNNSARPISSLPCDATIVAESQHAAKDQAESGRPAGQDVGKDLTYDEDVHLSIEIDREDDGRWIAEALELPGVMTYGETREEAISNTEKLAIEVIADRIKHGELPPSSLNVSFLVLSGQLAGD